MRPPALVALTPGDVEAGAERALVARVARARQAGLTGLLVRESRLSDAAFLALVRALRAELGDAAWVGISDRAHLAVAAGAQAIHLGFRSLRPAELARVLRAGRWVGLSTHAGDPPPDPREVDYAFHGPLRETASKAGLVPVVGPSGLGEFVARCPVPVWALGGVRPEDAAAALAAGAAGVAVLGGILGPATRDPAEASAAYLAALSAAAKAGRSES